jgi:hypothetical protein
MPTPSTMPGPPRPIGVADQGKKILFGTGGARSERLRAVHEARVKIIPRV